MNLEQGYLNLSEQLNCIEQPPVSCQQLISVMDLTLLDKDAGASALADLRSKAVEHSPAAICIYPEHLNFFDRLLNCKRATVINFPQGTQAIKQVLRDIENLISQAQVDEIDYVFPYQAYLEGQYESALNHCYQAYSLCKEDQITFKVILETAAHPSPESVYELSKEVISRGCDFLKTSTGKIASGATPLSVFGLLKAIQESPKVCGIKISGGIRDLSTALFYVKLASYILDKEIDKSWFRIGASSLLDEVLSSHSI